MPVKLRKCLLVHHGGTEPQLPALCNAPTTWGALTCRQRPTAFYSHLGLSAFKFIISSFLAALGLIAACRAFSSCSVSVSCCGGFGLSCPAACGIFQNQGSNLCPLYQQVDSLLLGGSGSKNLPATAGDPGSTPGSARSPGEENGNPPQYFCLENSTDGGAWQATVHGVAKELDMTE